MAQTNVTGTAVDNNGTPYINGTWTVNLFNPTTFQPTWQGSTSFTTSYGGALDGTGSFAVTLPSNTGAGSITVGGLTTTQWTFAFFTSDGENGFGANVVITGASQSITASIISAGRIVWETGDVNPPPCGNGQAVVSLGAGINGCGVAGGGSSFPVVTPVTVGTGGSITTTGTGTITATNGVTSVSVLPASCTPGVTLPVNLTINGVGYGVFYCASTNTFVPDNPQTTVSPLAYGAKADVKFTYAATATNGSTTITCTAGDCNFTAADVGKIVFGSSGQNSVASGLTVSVLFLPQTTIQSVTNANTIVVAGAGATASCTPGGSLYCALAWGTQDDAPALNLAAAAAWQTGGSCKALQLPSATMFIGGQVFGSTTLSSACGGTVGGISGQDSNQVGPELYGQGPGNSTLIPLPSFTGCTGGAGGTTCIGGAPNMEAHDFGVNGLGQNPASINNKILFELSGQSPACTGSTGFNLALAAWGISSTGSTGLVAGSGACGDPTYSNLVVEMFGALNCSFIQQSVVMVLNGVACFGNTAGGLSLSGGGVITSVGSYYGSNYTSGGFAVSASNLTGVFNSFGDVFAGPSLVAGTVFIASGGTSGTANLTSDFISLPSGTPSASQAIFLNNTTFNLHLRNTKIAATGANNRIAVTSAAGSAIFDDGGNTFIQGTLANSFTGGVFGSLSTTGSPLVTGNVVLSACGTSTASAFSGTSLKGQFTITFAGAPGANCTVTLTFPTPFPFVAPICTWTDVGGTNPFPTSIVNGATTTTSTAMTETATAFTNGNTEILQYSCQVP